MSEIIKMLPRFSCNFLIFFSIILSYATTLVIICFCFRSIEKLAAKLRIGGHRHIKEATSSLYGDSD